MFNLLKVPFRSRNSAPPNTLVLPDPISSTRVQFSPCLVYHLSRVVAVFEIRLYQFSFLAAGKSLAATDFRLVLSVSQSATSSTSTNDVVMLTSRFTPGMR